MSVTPTRQLQTPLGRRNWSMQTNGRAIYFVFLDSAASISASTGCRFRGAVSCPSRATFSPSRAGCCSDLGAPPRARRAFSAASWMEIEECKRGQQRLRLDRCDAHGLTPSASDLWFSSSSIFFRSDSLDASIRFRYAWYLVSVPSMWSHHRNEVE
jgi:hypothetical protein